MSKKTKVRVVCPYCGNDAELADSSEVYGGRSYGLIWICRADDAYVSVHGNSPNNAPLGRLANAELRALKMAAHKAFDPFWKSVAADAGRSRARKRAYQWLADALELPVAKTHIGCFDDALCRRVIEICEDARRQDPNFGFREN
jgi:hypothetical protein